MNQLSLLVRGGVVAVGLAGVGLLAAGATADDATKKVQEEWKAPARAAKKKNPIAAEKPSIAQGKKLYVIPYHRDIAVLLRERVDDCVLIAVRVLIFVHVNIVKTFLISLKDIGILLK